MVLFDSIRIGDRAFDFPPWFRTHLMGFPLVRCVVVIMVMLPSPTRERDIVLGEGNGSSASEGWMQTTLMNEAARCAGGKRKQGT